MRNLWVLVILLAGLSLGLGGCVFAPVQTGSKTITNYDKDGRVTSQVQEEKPIADTQTEYQETVRSVAQSESQRAQSQASNIKDTCSQNLEHFKGNDAAYALLGVFCAESIAKIKGVSPEVIKAIQRSKSGFEVAGELGGKLVDGSVIGMGLHAAGNIVGEVMDGVGDRTNVSNSGDGNTVNLSKKETTTITETHANTTGDGSAPVVNNNQTTSGCPAGNCAKEGDEGGDSMESNSSCLSDPTITEEFLSNIPGNCSSRMSYCAGRCSIKP